MYPSPFKDDGYDISDYTSIHPGYGTQQDFEHFLSQAHARGLRVIIELVLNHTSDQHAWFQEARSSPDNPRRDWYVWSDTDDRYRGVRIIFLDTELSNWAWDPVSKAYYWHRFFSHQPDLNYDNPAVREEIWEVMKFWLNLGVDGFRVDAVPYLVEREGTSCENLPETHAVLKELRARLDAHFTGKVLLAEANMWPEDVRPYFGAGDEFHMSFHFPIMPRMFMALRLEDRKPLIDIIERTPSIPDSCQWGIFLRNHDELTLEMVTEIERQYMWDEYAKDPRARINLGIRRRLAPLVEGDRRRIELMSGLLMSLPGSPILYYGDEIGMGDNVYLGDRNGVRTPMQWNGGVNAGFSAADPERLWLPLISNAVYGYQSVNVESQQRNATSLLNWTRRLIEVRRFTKVFGRGSIEFLKPDNHRVLAFTRSLGRDSVLVVSNLAGTAQVAELDLSRLAGAIPIEMFGGSIFPRITREPYIMMMGPYDFYWFRLRWLYLVENETTFSDALLRQLIAVGQVDILVGLPTLNNAATITDVVRAVHASFTRDFPRLRTVMLNSDGGSTDGTPDLVRVASFTEADTVQTSHSLRTLHRVVAPYHGLPGKHTALRTVFAAGELTQAKVVVVIDPGGPATTPERVTELIGPIARADVEFLAPRYRRHPRDGIFVTQVVRPLVRAIYGVALDEPLGAEFACSGRFASHCLEQDIWTRDAARFATDLWLRTEALAAQFSVGQIWRPATTAAGTQTTLREAVRQVVLSLIESLRAHESFWLKANDVLDLPTWGTDPLVMPDAATWDHQALAEQARHDIVAIKPLLEEVLEPAGGRATPGRRPGSQFAARRRALGAERLCVRRRRPAWGAPMSSTWPTCSFPSTCSAPRRSCRVPRPNLRTSCRPDSTRSVRRSNG